MSSGNANYDSYGPTTPVGRYKANSLGLHDMTGNVWEWVQDKFTGYGNVGTDNPVYERSGARRVVRGGSWTDEQRSLRCSSRANWSSSGELNNLGFRLVRMR